MKVSYMYLKFIFKMIINLGTCSEVAEWLVHWLLVLEVFNPCRWRGKFVGPNTLPFVSFVGMA